MQTGRENPVKHPYQESESHEVIVQTGKSRFNGQDFAVVATGIDTPSTNRKTGPMVQLTILDANVAPHTWASEKQDKSVQHTVCGDCVLSRPQAKATPTSDATGGCYVALHTGILGVWKKFRAGGYPAFDIARLTGRAIRFGAWGEPSLISLKMIRRIVGVASNWTGYTHQWSKRWAQGYKTYLMASVQTVQASRKQTAAGGGPSA